MAYLIQLITYRQVEQGLNPDTNGYFSHHYHIYTSSKIDCRLPITNLIKMYRSSFGNETYKKDEDGDIAYLNMYMAACMPAI